MENITENKKARKRLSALDKHYDEIITLRNKGLSIASITILINEKLSKKLTYHGFRRFMSLKKIL